MIDPELRDPDYWKPMRRKFLKLDPEFRLTLHWSYFQTAPVGQQHYFAPAYDNDFELIEAEFYALCARAGRVINSSSPVQGWTLELWRRSNRKLLQKSEQFIPGTQLLAACVTGEIKNPCELSAILCARYERWMLETNPPPNSKSEPINEVVVPSRSSGTKVKSHAVTRPAKRTRKRRSSMIESLSAVEKLEGHLIKIRNRGISLTDFCGRGPLSERTLRDVRKTKKARPDTFKAIARAMGIEFEKLMDQ